MPPAVRLIEPATFEAVNHYYPRVPNARLHPVVRHFLSLGNARIAQRYCHLHPEVDPVAVRDVLSRPARVLRWAGADLLVTTSDRGHRQLVVVEVNSSPSGQKSMPLVHEEDELGGYRRLLERVFWPMLQTGRRREGVLVVAWDKNEMETTGYAAALAELAEEPVHLVHLPADDPEPALTWDERGGWLRAEGEQQPVRGCFRYVTQRPWTRLPPVTRVPMLNPVLACLAGGRNKLVAAKAYEFYNAELAASRLRIRVPETIWDVSAAEVPLWVQRMGGVAVVKNPYSNAGQGVYTLVSDQELQDFMALNHRYDRFIVQALVGNVGWSSRGAGDRLYHVGTVPDRRGKLYASDLRFMVGSGPEGFLPVALYARRARDPLTEAAPVGNSSWGMLGTNLSKRVDGGGFTTEPERLMLMDSRDFNDLGIGLDDLTEGYLQTVLAVTAIDRMAERLLTRKGTFRRRLFRDLNPDPAFLAEVRP